MAETMETGAPTEGHADTIYLSLELSEKVWLITLCAGLGGKLSRHKLGAGDVAGVLRLIERARRGRAVPVVSCYEAGGDGFWLHRRLVAAGIENVVIDPTSLRVDRRARRRKSDRLDGEAMVRALIDWRRGDRRALRVVRVPSPELEDGRRRERERERLVQERTAHVNRVRGLLVAFGIALVGEGRRIAAPRWLDWLSEQRLWDGNPMPPHLLGELQREHERLLLIERQLAALTRSRPALPAPQQKQAQALMQLRGIGRAIAHGYAGEVLWRDFVNRRQVGAYMGLDPSPWRSGKVAHEQGIGRAGNRRARRLMTEAAWLWLHHQPQSAFSRWFRHRVGDARGRVRRVTIIALARKLAVLLWRIATTGDVPADVVLKRRAIA